MILEQGIALEYVDELGGALGTSSGGCIRLLNGLSPAMEFTTLVHGHAHPPKTSLIGPRSSS